MATESFQVINYQYSQYSSRTAYRTSLVLRAGLKTCAIIFIDDPNAALPAAKKVGNNYFEFYFHQHQFPHLIDMVRHENPIYVHYSDSVNNNSRISTSNEPIGEEES